MQDRQAGGYPWRGMRLAPITLRDILRVALPPEYVAADNAPVALLADLDERAWVWFSDQQCVALADLIITHVREQTSLLTTAAPLSDRFLPPCPRNLRLADLDLSNRTHKALQRTDLGRWPDLIGVTSISRVLHLRSFGAKSLVELLVALEEAGKRAAPADLPSADELADGVVDSLPPAFDIGPGLDDIEADPSGFGGGLSEQEVGVLGAWSRGEIDSLPAPLLRRRLPPIPEATQIDDLPLQPRTVGAISRAGHAHIGRWLPTTTIRDILALPHFGRTSFRDLLDGLIWLMVQPPPRADLTQLAKEIAETELAARLESGDPRLGGAGLALGRPGETLREAAERIAARSRDPADLGLMALHLSNVKSAVEQLGNQSLEEELLGLLGTLNRDRHGAAFARYHGWDGQGGAVLQTVGDEFGVTRERVRQMCVKVEKRLPATALPMPALERALALVAERAPLWADDVADVLHDAGVTQGHFGPKPLLHAARKLGLNASFHVQEVGGRERVFHIDDDTSSEFDQLLRVVRRIGRRTVEHWGVGRVQDVARLAAKESGAAVDPALVEDTLTQDDGFRWLHQERGWYWNADVPRNRLTNQIDKVLCVAESIALPELRVAVARNYRMEGQAPPLDILTEFCRQAPNRVVEDDRVRAEPQLKPAVVLSDTELLFYTTLGANGSLMTRAELETQCRAAGMTRVTFYMGLSNSPILTSPRRGVYALIGFTPTDSQLDQLVVSRLGRGRVLLAAGRLSEARFWLWYRVSENMLEAGVFGLPNTMRPALLGNYDLKFDGGSATAVLSVREASAGGLVPYLRHVDARPGCYLALEFDVQTREAVATLGHEDLHAQFVERSLAFASDWGDLDDDDLDDVVHGDLAPSDNVGEDPLGALEVEVGADQDDHRDHRRDAE